MSGWIDRAVCANRDPRLWDGIPVSRSKYSGLDYSKAKAICATCPVRRACLDDALATGDYVGVMRGGVHPDDLARLAKDRRVTRRVAL